MKKLLILAMSLFLLLGLVACNQAGKNLTDVSTNKGNIKVDKTNTNTSDNEKSKTDDAQQNESKSKNKEEGTTEDSKQKQQTYSNEAFKGVTVKKTDAEVVVTGKARVFEGVFRYVIIAGNDTIKQDHYQTKGAPAWGDFKITFKKDLIDKKGAKLKLYVNSAKDGSATNALIIPLQ